MTDDSLKTALKVAAEQLGITLKDKQQEAILAFLSGRDVFISLPTGYGKSYIYGMGAITILCHAN